MTVKDINNKNIFVNFPHILLQKVFNHCDIVDRISFTLVCKTWYENKNGFLVFLINEKLIKSIFQNNIKLFNLKSYILQYNHLKNFQPSKLKIQDFEKIHSFIQRYSYLKEKKKNNENIENDLVIPFTVYGVKFSYVPNDSFIFSTFMKILSISNINKIEIDVKIDKPIPPNIKCFILNSNDFDIKYLPATLDKLIIKHNYRKTIKPKDLPVHLRHLEFKFDRVPDVDRGSLPSSLEVLLLPNVYTFSNLSDCLFSSRSKLHTLSIISNWLPNVKSLNTLKNITVYVNPGNVLPTDIISSSVEKLSLFIKESNTKSLINNSLSHLNGLRVLFLQVATNQPLDLGRLPYTIKSLTLSGNYIMPKLHSGLEFLDFGSQCNHKINSGMIPNTVKILCFSSNYREKIHRGTIPKSVEYIDFKNYKLPISESIIPISVNRIRFESPKFLTFNYCYGDSHVIPSSITKMIFEYKSNIIKIKRINIDSKENYLIVGHKTINGIVHDLQDLITSFK